MGDVLDATLKAVAAASHLTAMDDGAVEALLTLAQKIDTDDAVREAYLTQMPEGGRPLQLDNVSIPTYLKFCDALGLTPAGRERLAEKKGPAGGGKLAKLRAVQGGKS